MLVCMHFIIRIFATCLKMTMVKINFVLVSSDEPGMSGHETLPKKSVLSAQYVERVGFSTKNNKFKCLEQEFNYGVK